MKKLIVPGIILLVLFIGYRFFAGSYNSMVEKDEEVNTQWAQVETQYQRRADLIPNLVNTVKGYADFEKDVLVGVTEARAKASSIEIDPSNMTPAQMQQFQEAQGQLNSALGRLLVTIERYPDLKANQNFLELQAQLEGTENRIAVERKRYNDTVKVYNIYIRQFPRTLIAGWFGFNERPVFEAQEGTENAPVVDFN